MGILSSLFSSGEIVNTAIKTADKLNYSDQEKSDVVKSLYDEYTPRALSRRLIAINIAVIFTVYCLAALGFAAFDKMSIVDNIINVAEKLRIGWCMITVVIFYFGYYGMEKIKKD